MKAGVAVHAFTFERAFANIGQYATYTGCFVNQLSLSVKPNEMLSGTLSIIGLSGERGTTPLAASSTTGRRSRTFRQLQGLTQDRQSGDRRRDRH
uniref:phage tail tube protein n=1 Tax=uncultured Bilophila sp. TaxID=529385 RepID=UPI00345BF90F